MSVYGGKDQTTTRNVAVEVVVGLVLAALTVAFFNSSLGLLGTTLAVSVLVALAVMIIAVLTGLPARTTQRWRDYRMMRLVNKDSRLVPEAARLTRRMYDIIYLNSAGALQNLLQQIDPSHSQDFQRLGVGFKIFQQLFESQARWHPLLLLYVVWGVAGHFAVIDPYLEMCYQVASRATVPGQTMRAWEAFAEEYNHIREAWRSYGDHMQNLLRWSVTISGSPARLLPAPGPGSSRS